MDEGRILLGTGSSFAIDLSWYTVGPGGQIDMTAGSLSVSGSIGERDAGVMTSGTLELRGGFWAGIDRTCLGDVNEDGATDLTDLALVLADFGCAGGCAADVSGDGNTDLSDLALVLAYFGCN